jgi:hypothetical protein
MCIRDSIRSAVKIFRNIGSTQLVLIPPDLGRIIKSEFIKRCIEKGFDGIEEMLQDPEADDCQ